MKTKKYILLPVLLMFSACEKIIQVDLNSANPRIIVEARISNKPGPYQVMISRSVNYYDPNVFPPVTGAVVTIADNAGHSETLSEVTPGHYQTSALQGQEGLTYQLSIQTSDGKKITAQSTMPYHVPIDSVNFQVNNRGDGYRVICRFPDPPYEVNYYQLQLSSPDSSALDSTRIRTLTDGLADGQELSLTYRTNLLLGDSVHVKLECIDRSTYDFYRTVPNVEGDLRSFLSAPPANPLTNLSSGALGYFSAYAVSDTMVMVH